MNKIYAIYIEEDCYYDEEPTSAVIGYTTNIEEAGYIKNNYDAWGSTVRAGEVKKLTKEILDEEQKLYKLMSTAVIQRKQLYFKPIQEFNTTVDEVFDSSKPHIDFNEKYEISVYSLNKNQIQVVVGLLFPTEPTEKEVDNIVNDVKNKVNFILKNCEKADIRETKEITKMIKKLNNKQRGRLVE
ncbi:hypothetical protein VL10_ORF32 [Staphylococcus phage vB_SauM_VL10]|nr:hypothetical protein VL10_ORF32 [Staphylococcus phage vB_SauM_VL10]